LRLLASTFLLTLAAPINALDISAFKDSDSASGSRAANYESELNERINDLERTHSQEIIKLKERIEELELILRRMQQATETRLQKEERLAFERRRGENWARVTNGMRRQDVYRLLGRGIKDTKSTIDCRCYTRGRVCFNDDDQSIKSDLHCKL